MPDPIATLILTRPDEASERFLEQMGGDLVARVRVVISPLLEIVPTGTRPDVSGVRGVIFTSPNGVRFGGRGNRLPTYCVGPATTAAAAKAGWDARQAGATADALVETLCTERPPGPLLHIGGVHRRGCIAVRLREAGIETAEIDVYDQRLLPLNAAARRALSDAAPVVVLLFSPRAARQFAAQTTTSRRMHLVAISDAVMAETAAIPAASRHVARDPDAESMCNTLANLLRWVEADDSPK